MSNLSRRAFLGVLAAPAAAAVAASLQRKIPSSAELLPLVGLGSARTFNVGTDRAARDECAEVLRAFFAAGGRLIDSSPMYDSSQEVIGYGLTKLDRAKTVFSADKVWTSAPAEGPGQIESSRRKWGVERFDLLQVHNLVSWEGHLRILREMKAAGRLRAIGVTTSHGRRHEELERILRAEPLDFVQFSYSALSRDVEARLLPLARERGVAVIVNRPFEQGDLIRRVERHPLPAWAAEIGCVTWAQVLLKFVVSHPAVTCAIPATTQVAHVRENLAAASQPLPDEAMRRRIASHVADL
jgi:diketogulonate reductase-like aldo/keto reductase